MQNTRFNSVGYETTKIEIREGKKYWEISEKCILLFFPFHLIHRSNYRKILPYICNGIFFQFYFAFSKEIDQYIFFCKKGDTRKRSTIHLINLQLIFYSSVHFFLNIWNLCQTNLQNNIQFFLRTSEKCLLWRFCWSIQFCVPQNNVVPTMKKKFPVTKTGKNRILR